LADEDVKRYVGYMLKQYNEKADREGVIKDYFCFTIYPLPSNAGTKLSNKTKQILKTTNIRQQKRE